MPSTTRTFIGLKLSDSARDRIAKVAEHLAPKAPGVKWVERENLHVTLAFLGDVPDADLPSLCRSVASTVAPVPRFRLQIQGFGSFPPHGRPRVLWVGLEGPDLPRMQELYHAVVAGAGAAGYPPTDNRFHPHITLGRLKGPSGPEVDPSALFRPFSLWSAGILDARQVTVFASRPTPTGPAYAVLSSAPLGRQPSA